MKAAFVRWTIYLTALFVIGPLAGLLTGALRNVDGGTNATPLVSSNPALGVAAAVGAIAIAVLVGAVGARLMGVGPGFSAAGLVLAWVAWRTGEVNELIRSAQSSSPLVSLAIEGLLMGVLALLAACGIAWIAQRQIEDPPHRYFGARPLPALAAGFIGAGIGAWLVAVTPLKGQAVAAAVVSAIFGAAAGRLVDLEAPLPLLAVPTLLWAAVGPLTGFITKGSAVVPAAYAGALFPTANITPLDFVAGVFLGAPVGISWAASLSSGRIGP